MNITLTPTQIDQFLALVRQVYPDWQNFNHPAFVADEVDYKQRAAGLMRTQLGRAEFERLLRLQLYDEIVSRLEKVAQATNLLYLSTPQSGDLRILYAATIDRGELCRQLFNLLHGNAAIETRLQHYLDFVGPTSNWNYWTFPTYFLFLAHPDREIFVKPILTQRYLTWFGLNEGWSGKLSVAAYIKIVSLLQQLQRALQPYAPHDFIDIQSLLWVAFRQPEQLLIPADKRAEFATLFQEFVAIYPQTAAGQLHSAHYAAARAEAQRNYAAILTAQAAGQTVTDHVLEHLLPYEENPTNQQRGVWIHPAPTITNDIRTKYERTSWWQSGDWPAVSQAILDFVSRCVANPHELASACQAFSESPHSKGFQVGMLTPILNALRPNDYVLLNAKPLKVLNHLANTNFRQTLTDYPGANATMHQLHQELAPILATFPMSLSPGDAFDMFCHWLVAVKKYDFTPVQYWKIAPGENAWQWADCLAGNFIAIGWDELGDITGLSGNEFNTRRDTLVTQHTDWTKSAVDQVWAFSKIQEGDRVIANRGTTQVLGIGTVTGPYYFAPNVRHGHRLPVTWDDTTLRPVDQGGWRRTLLKLDQAIFAAILATKPNVPAPLPIIATPDLDPAAPFTQTTFELLAQLHAEPTAAFYLAHKDDFVRYVEEPFKRVLLEVGRRLPAPIHQVMETEKRIFARFLKNDWGQGGAWDYFWGAFYPKGSKRSQDAQLSLWMNDSYLEFGFFIGHYASEQRLRFQRNCTHNAGPLTKLMTSLFRPGEVILGARDEFTVTPDGAVIDPLQRTWADFLRNPSAATCDVSVVIPAPTLLTFSFEQLVERVLSVHRRLFPLVLAALEEDPMPAIGTYLQPFIDIDDDPPSTPYTAAQFLHETNLRSEEMLDLLDLLKEKQQLILQGPPGVGKTYIAQRLARLLTGLAQPGPRVQTVQFHPAYGYEDFIEGIRPTSKTTVTGQQVVEYPVLAGRFVEFCAHATHTGDLPHVFIIDEINRGNIPRIFGELLYLLEYRTERVVLPYSGKPFQIPANVYLIGTMNTADRSIALVDFALRRRFNFVTMAADPNLFDRWLTTNPVGLPYLSTLYRRLCHEAIDDPNYHIGPSYFMQPDLSEAKLARIWRYNIEPLLHEYYAENPKQASLWAWEGELLYSIRQGG